MVSKNNALNTQSKQMIKLRNVTEKELLIVMLSCNWQDPTTRIKFAAQGLYLNVLKEDKNQKVRWAVAQFQTSEEFEIYQYQKQQNPTRNYR